MPAAVTRHHAEWLSLVEVSGPFLTLPVLERAFPQGLDGLDGEQAAELRRAYGEWQADPALHGQWVRFVLRSLLGFGGGPLAEGPAVPEALRYQVPEHGELLRPDLAVLDPDGARPRLLVSVWPASQAVDRNAEDAGGWVASPRERMVELLRGTGTRLGLVTNGESWTLVDAPAGTAAGLATWEAALWLEEPLALRAFTSLLGPRRFFAVPEGDTLEALLAASANAQQEVTDQLGRQVRLAVEMLVEALGRADRESGGELLRGVGEVGLYRGVVTVLMRLVFLLAAEERGLFLLGDPLYDESYAVSTLLARLREAASARTEEALERRAAAWHRLLATFRMVHTGVQHERMRLPAYGGALFDPARFPFLERAAVDDRTVLHLLDALQVLRRQPRRSGPAEAQRLSYRALDVEQIGHVYEGLLDHTAVRASEPAAGLDGKLEPEVSLRELERAAAEGTLETLLAELTGESAKWVGRRLGTEAGATDLARLRAACDNDEALAARLEPFLGLLRRDLRGDPVVFLPGSVYVTRATERRSSGTFYTPRALAEEVVRHTLDPLCYRPGPAEGAEPGSWRLRPAGELLSLTVCDPAMGSGAFLVGACRYLATRVVEAWDAAGTERVRHNGDDLVLPPAGSEERELVARRLVADRCLFGVDVNPMAVEMAKLSLWLVTLAKGRPFTFLDHALRCGDSLLGITSTKQLVFFHPDPVRGDRLHARLFDSATDVIERAVADAAEARRKLESFPVLDVRDATDKERLLAQAGEATRALRVVADAVAGSALTSAGKGADALDARLRDAAPLVATALDPATPDGERAVALSELERRALGWLQAGKPPGADERHPFHWPLEFPEVDAFDAVVGNPPFLGGQKLTGTLGTDYRAWLVEWLASGRRGSADLVVYFLLRACQLASAAGVLATNTVAQGDSREVGLEHLTAGGWSVTRAVKSRSWPGTASLEVSQVWLNHRSWDGTVTLDGVPVRAITPTLEPASRVSGKAHRLRSNAAQCFQGVNILGVGFLISPAEAKELVDRDSRNRDVLFPYLNGEDLNSSPNQSPSRWVINFFDWPVERAATYKECFTIVEQHVKPFRLKNKNRQRRELWWRFTRPAPDLHRATAGLERVVVIALVSKTVALSFVPFGMIFSHMLGVYPYDDDAHFGILSSAFHYWWAVTHASTLETRVRYTPSDCFETFPQPDLTPEVANAGRRLDEHRRAMMLERQEGLTATYNRVADPAERSEDVEALRRLHVELDHAVAVAYGWEDLPMDHDFHDTRQGPRYTLGPVTRTEVLDRLLELNHARHRAEALSPRGGVAGQAALDL